MRVIPCLLLKDGGLVKTMKFRNPAYVGDPINAVKIFNDKEVDELFLLDIEASRRRRGPDFPLLERVAREAFMPMGYGGGIRSLEDVRKVLELGYEKAVINTAAWRDPEFIPRCSEVCGAQSVVVSLDIKRDLFGRARPYAHAERKPLGGDPAARAAEAVRAGAGEILLNAVDRDGTFGGYDLPLIRQVSGAVEVPLVAAGGAARLEDFALAARNGASAVAAGSLFVYFGPRRAVLINYPSKNELKSAFSIGEAPGRS
jgi:imidazole glycerol-phosphate synthase subunit HisF